MTREGSEPPGTTGKLELEHTLERICWQLLEEVHSETIYVFKETRVETFYKCKAFWRLIGDGPRQYQLVHDDMEKWDTEGVGKAWQWKGKGKAANQRDREAICTRSPLLDWNTLSHWYKNVHFSHFDISETGMGFKSNGVL